MPDVLQELLSGMFMGSPMCFCALMMASALIATMFILSIEAVSDWLSERKHDDALFEGKSE